MIFCYNAGCGSLNVIGPCKLIGDVALLEQVWPFLEEVCHCGVGI